MGPQTLVLQVFLFPSLSFEKEMHKEQPLCSLQGIDFDKFEKDHKGLTLGYRNG